jgi:uncharacterized delta-60 repeat protein
MGVFTTVAWAAAGQLDTSFSGDGRQLTHFPGATGGDEGNAVAIGENGKIVAAGYSKAGPEKKFAVARYTSNGSLDRRFSSDGRVLTRFPGSIGDREARAVATENGKIVVAGYALVKGKETANLKFALARYNQNGSLDHSFSGDGRVLTSFPGDILNKSDQANAVAIEENGKIVAAGYSYQRGGPVEKFAVARYNSNGSLDHTFSRDGRVVTGFGGQGTDEGEAVAVQPNGRIVAAGYSSQGLFARSSADFAIARYKANGSLDRSFSGDGRVLTSFPGADGIGGSVRGLAIENGRIVAAGLMELKTGPTKFAVARYNSIGSLDHSFSGDGRVLTSFPGGRNNDGASSVAVENGKVVVAGGSQRAHKLSVFALARYNSNGSLDRRFSDDGRVLTRFPGGTGFNFANGVAVESGKIVAAGFSRQAGGVFKFALARYLDG